MTVLDSLAPNPARTSHLSSHYKRCPRCSGVKALGEFRLNRSKPDGRDSYCRPCRNAYANPYKRRQYWEDRAALGMMVIGPEVPVVERFWAKVVRGIGGNVCWTWLGAMMPGGYAKFQVHGKNVPAHRYSYELHKGPIPPGLQIDHLCRNRGCVNPYHLEAVTPAENQRRANLVTRRGGPTKTHCVNGHPWTPENITERKGSRTCRLCLVAANARYEAAHVGRPRRKREAT